ncbi:transposase for insertion sequence element ISRM3 domain protein [Shigella dysenteriae 155-74]|nr:transposase for insertion sequence element ISRM3 domain protein [Shigella dysenteriae 155-74]VDG84871.1 transposase [Shigella dysenteriae]
MSLYAKGMTTREIVATFKEMYDADVSPTLISKVTDAVKEQVSKWQNRPLDALYPIVYLDCIVVKVRHGGSVINKAVFLALGINTDGQKELLGMWLAENEGAKFWLGVLSGLKNRPHPLTVKHRGVDTVVWKVPGNWLFTRILFWFMRSIASGEKCISCVYCILHRSGHRGAVRI